MQEHTNLSTEIYEVLKDGRQLSISGITRELKSRNLNEHRLIVTGYLRAMHDLDRLNEFDLSPSKIYTLKNNEPLSKSNKKEEKETANGKRIYDLIGEKTSKMNVAVRLETTAYILTTLFDRPCFESELNAVGIDSLQIARYFTTENLVRFVFKSKSDSKKYYEEIPSIPKNSQAYDIYTEKLDGDFFIRTVNILTAVLREEIDVSELVSKTANKSLLDF
jgi:hypothetical protein